jgi:hypothetical protein
MTLEWETCPNSDTAVFMVGGMIPILMRAHDQSWSLRGVDGRRKTGAASSRADARLECLKGIEELLRTGLSELSGALQTGSAGPAE